MGSIFFFFLTNSSFIYLSKVIHTTESVHTGHHSAILDGSQIAIKTAGLCRHAEQTHSKQNKYWIHSYSGTPAALKSAKDAISSLRSSSLLSPAARLDLWYCRTYRPGFVLDLCGKRHYLSPPSDLCWNSAVIRLYPRITLRAWWQDHFVFQASQRRH